MATLNLAPWAAWVGSATSTFLCRHPDHNPPPMPPLGISHSEHTCPGCGMYLKWVRV